MSSDPKKPFDAPPGETPDLLQQDVSLERRRRVPTFEELQAQRSSGEVTTDPVRPAIPHQQPRLLGEPKPTGIPMGTVPARPSSLDTGHNAPLVPPGMTPRQLTIEPTTDPVRPALARPPLPVPTVPPPAPGVRPPPQPPPPSARSNPSASGIPPVPGGAQLPGLRTPPPPGAPQQRSAPNASGMPQVPGGAQPPGMRTPPPATGLPRMPIGMGLPQPPPQRSPSGTGIPQQQPPTRSSVTAPSRPGVLPTQPAQGGVPQRTPVPSTQLPQTVPYRTTPIPPFRSAPDPITKPMPIASAVPPPRSEPITAPSPIASPIPPPGLLDSTGQLPAYTPNLSAAPAAMLDRTGVLPPNTRAAPPSPTDFAQSRASVQNLPQVTPMTPMVGALPPSDSRPRPPEPLLKPPPERAPVPLGGEDELEPHDEPKTVPASNNQAQRVAPPPPAPGSSNKASYGTLPPAHALPPEMLVTQPGLPGPFAKARGMPQNKAVPQRPPSLPDLQMPQEPLPQTGLAPELQPPAPAPATGQQPAFEAAPSFEHAEEDRPVTAEPASLWRRVGAYLTDLLFVSVLVLGLLFLAVEFVAPKNLSTLQQLMVIAMPAAILTGLIAFVYTALFAFLWDGRTPGRRMMGIHLVDATGQAPSALRSLIRAALSLVSFALFLSGFWLALFDRHGQTLHDKLTRTFVVKLQDA